MLALDQQAFDQSPSGWRMLEQRSGCFVEAADLIRDWRKSHHAKASILLWHEGQNRAMAGRTAHALRLFGQARKLPGEEMAEAWNIYVDGTIAFLRRDRSNLLEAIRRLEATSQPTNFKPVDARGQPITVKWPPNLAVLEGFLRCWNDNYRIAYSCPR